MENENRLNPSELRKAKDPKKYYIDLFNVKRIEDYGSKKDRNAAGSVPEVLHFMDSLIEEKQAFDFEQLHEYVRQYYAEEPAAAQKVLERALQELDFVDPFTKANLNEHCGRLEALMGKFSEAEGRFREAEEIYRARHADISLATVLEARGDLAICKNEFPEADACYREAERVYRRTYTLVRLASLLKSRGDLSMRMDKLPEAENYYREAEELCDGIGDNLGLADVLAAIGHMLQVKSNYEGAAENFEAAAELYKKLHEKEGAAVCCAELCFCSAKLGDPDTAKKYRKRMVRLLSALTEDVKEYCDHRVREAREMLGVSI